MSGFEPLRVRAPREGATSKLIRLVDLDFVNSATNFVLAARDEVTCVEKTSTPPTVRWQQPLCRVNPATSRPGRRQAEIFWREPLLVNPLLRADETMFAVSTLDYFVFWMEIGSAGAVTQWTASVS